LCVAGAFATVGNIDIYSKLVSTATVPIGATLNPTDTHRDCMISPSSNSFPTQTVHAATVSVLAGYTVTYAPASNLKMCCAFYGHLDLVVGSPTHGHCTNNVCSVNNFDLLAYDGYNSLSLGTQTPKDYGTNYYLSSNSVLNNLCFPVNQCYVVDTSLPTPLKSKTAVASEPWQQSGVNGLKTDNFYNRPGLPTVIRDPSLAPTSPLPFINSVRTGWIQFGVDYNVVNGVVIAPDTYIIPYGIYSTYEIFISNTVVCDDQSDPTKPPASPSGIGCKAVPVGTITKYSKLACRDRGAYDGANCYLPCGYSYTGGFVLDQSTSTGNDATGLAHTPAAQTFTFGICYANCVAHA